MRRIRLPRAATALDMGLTKRLVLVCVAWTVLSGVAHAGSPSPPPVEEFASGETRVEFAGKSPNFSIFLGGASKFIAVRFGVCSSAARVALLPPASF